MPKSISDQQLRLPLDDVSGEASAVRGPAELLRALVATHSPGLALGPLRVSSRMRRTLGSFRPGRQGSGAGQITLSARLLALGTEPDIMAVLLHEVAHAIAHARSPRAPSHGRLFREVCREIGARPSKYVDVSAKGWAERTRFSARCAACRGDIVRRRRFKSARCGCGALVAPRRWDVVVHDVDGEVRRLGTSAPPARRDWRAGWRRPI